MASRPLLQKHTGFTGSWNRDLDTDLRDLAADHVHVLVSLMEDFEYEMCKIFDLHGKSAEHGIAQLHFPIKDMTPPKDFVSVLKLTYAEPAPKRP